MVQGRVLASIFILICLNHLTPVQAQLDLEESTTYNITINASGSASWVIERRFMLSNAEEAAIFQDYIAGFVDSKQLYLSDFINKTTALVDQASLITGRSMRVDGFDIIVGSINTATGSYGVIKYQYDWVGFARVEGERIAFGDVFEGGFYLFLNDALVIKYPSGYVVQAASPDPDESREETLVWYGRRNFGAGEPMVILGPSADYVPLIIGVALVGGLVLLGLYFFKFRRVKPEAGVAGRVEEVFDFSSEEEKVLGLIGGVGGKVYQSVITKRLGFSKAKTSLLLKDMEERGLVERKRIGREMLVTLRSRDK